MLFLGAGEADIGIADLIISHGAPGLSAARSLRCWFFGPWSRCVNRRTDLADHKLAYAHEVGRK